MFYCISLKTNPQKIYEQSNPTFGTFLKMLPFHTWKLLNHADKKPCYKTYKKVSLLSSLEIGV